MELKKIYLFEVLLIVLVAISPLITSSMEVAITLILIFFNRNYIKKTNKKVLIYFFIIECLLFLGLVNDLKNDISNFSVLNFYFPLSFFLGFILSHKYSLKELGFYIEKIAFFSAIFSIIGVVLYSFFPTIVYNLPTYNYYHTSHKTAIFFNVLVDSSGIIHRNTGIASEPGLFQLLLNLGLLFYIKNNDKIDLRKIAVYSIALFTTRSTAGLIIYLFILFDIIKKYKIMIIPIFALIFIYSEKLLAEISYQYKYKMFGSSSFKIRLDPMLNVFKMGLSLPLGLGNTGYNLVYSQFQLGAWDSYGQILIRYGYLLLAIILIMMFQLYFKDKSLFLIIALTFISQGIWYVTLITTILFLGLKKEKSKEDVIKLEN